MHEHGTGDVLVIHGGQVKDLAADRDIVLRAVAVGGAGSTLTGISAQPPDGALEPGALISREIIQTGRI